MNTGRWLGPLLATAMLLASGHVALAQNLIIKNGSSLKLNSAILKGTCTDLTVESGGTLNFEGGAAQDLKNVSLHSGANVFDATGMLSLAGTWSNDSSFIKDPSSQIIFYSGCDSGSGPAANNAIGLGDTDGDGVTDSAEMFNDRNNDGLPDFLDPAIRVDIINARNSLIPIIQLLLMEDE